MAEDYPQVELFVPNPRLAENQHQSMIDIMCKNPEAEDDEAI